jgi:serine/threonine protein kinase
MSDPQMFGRYLLLDKVAAGGMAEVWRAKMSGEANFQRIVAIKKILPHIAEDEDFIGMFTDEALITASLTHANIGQVYEFNRIGDTFFIAMEYISGKDLKSVWSWCRHRKSVMPLPLSVLVVQKLADGLEYAHSRVDSEGHPAAVVHRDVSPQNVLISWEGDVKVIDFGIAKATEKSGKTRPGTLKGKFAYMAPEQIRGLPLDGRSDLFALGVVLYEMVTGERAFQAESEFSLLELVRNVEIRPPAMLNENLPAELERIIYKALHKDRGQRYASCADFSEDLQRFALTQGKPANARDLAAYLRANFTVDWEREKARLESYRDASALPSNATPSALPSVNTPILPFRPVGHADDDDPFAPSTQAEVSAGAARPATSNSSSSGSHRPAARPGYETSLGKRVITEVSSSLPRPHAGMPDPRLADAATIRNPASPAPREPSGKTVTQMAARPPVSRLGLWIAVLLSSLVLLAAAMVFVPPYLVERRTVVVTIDGPPQATVHLDDRHGLAAPSLTLADVSVGSHGLVVEAPGHVAFSTTIQVTGELPVVSITAPLVRTSMKVKVTTQPSGAVLLVDGAVIEGSAPATLVLPAGSRHEVVARLTGHREARAELTVTDEQDQRLELVLKPRTNRIRVVSVPEGAEVKLGGTSLGVTPLVLTRDAEDPFPTLVFSHAKCTSLTTTIEYDRDAAEGRHQADLTCR